MSESKRGFLVIPLIVCAIIATITALGLMAINGLPSLSLLKEITRF